MARNISKRGVAKRANKSNPRTDRLTLVYDSDNNELDAQRKPKKKIQLLPRNLAQEEYVDLLEDQSKHIVIAMGPAGCGKSYMATLYAIREFQAGNIDKIIIARPNVQNGEELGILPGNIIQKLGPSCAAVLDIFKEFFPARRVEQMLLDEDVELAPVGLLRGRTFKNALVIVEEAQNLTPNQAKMIFTRIGENCRIFMNGDILQHDRGFEQNGLKDFIERLEARGKSNSIAVCRFSNSDIERHPIIEEILHIYGE